MHYLPIIFFLCATLSATAKPSQIFLPQIARTTRNDTRPVKKFLPKHNLFYAYSAGDVVSLLLQELDKIKLGSYDETTARKKIFAAITLATCKELYIRYLWYANRKSLAVFSHLLLQNLEIILNKNKLHSQKDELFAHLMLKNILPLTLMVAQNIRHNI